MVNIITIAFVHAILFIAAFRLMTRSDLDADMVAVSKDEAASDKPDATKVLSPSERRRARLRASQEAPDK